MFNVCTTFKVMLRFTILIKIDLRYNIYMHVMYMYESYQLGTYSPKERHWKKDMTFSAFMFHFYFVLIAYNYCTCNCQAPPLPLCGALSF